MSVSSGLLAPPEGCSAVERRYSRWILREMTVGVVAQRPCHEHEWGDKKTWYGEKAKKLKCSPICIVIRPGSITNSIDVIVSNTNVNRIGTA